MDLFLRDIVNYIEYAHLNYKMEFDTAISYMKYFNGYYLLISCAHLCVSASVCVCAFVCAYVGICVYAHVYVCVLCV